MVSPRGVLIGFLVMALGFVVLFTALSPEFLFSTGIVSIGFYNLLQNQFKIWFVAVSLFIMIMGLVIMGTF